MDIFSGKIAAKPVTIIGGYIISFDTLNPFSFYFLFILWEIKNKTQSFSKKEEEPST